MSGLKIIVVNYLKQLYLAHKWLQDYIKFILYGPELKIISIYERWFNNWLISTSKQRLSLMFVLNHKNPFKFLKKYRTQKHKLILLCNVLEANRDVWCRVYLPALQMVEVNKVIRLSIGNLCLWFDFFCFMQLFIWKHLYKTFPARLQPDLPDLIPSVAQQSYA